MNLAINATGHVGRGNVRVTLPASSIQVTYAIQTPGIAPVEQTDVFGNEIFEVTTTGSVNQTLPAATVSIGTLTACLPASTIPTSVKLKLNQTNSPGTNFRLCENPLLGSFCTPDPVKDFGSKENIWGPWRDLKDVSWTNFPGAVATNLGLTVQSRCTAYNGSLADAVADFGSALHIDDSVNSGLNLSPELATWFANLIECMAVHMRLLTPPGENGPTDAQRSEWLSAEKDILGIFADAPAPSLFPTQAGTVDAFNRICFGTTGSETWYYYCNVTVDPGGDDQYENAAAAANGNLALVLDEGGNDYYNDASTIAACQPGNTDCVLTAGGSDGGVGIIVDKAGSDHYVASAATGVGGGLAGAGLLIDLQGSDHYTSNWANDNDRCHIACGVDGGIGIVYDEDTGEDWYTANAGGTLDIAAGQTGGLGLLVDTKDVTHYTYNGGGDIDGLAIAFGEYGGIGALVDGAGNDDYTCVQSASLCIGSADSGGTGILYDGSGTNQFNLNASGGSLAKGGLGAAADVAGGPIYFIVGSDEPPGPQTYNCHSLFCWGTYTGTFLDLAKTRSHYNPDGTYQPAIGSWGDCTLWLGAKDSNGDPLAAAGGGFDQCPNL